MDRPFRKVVIEILPFLGYLHGYSPESFHDRDSGKKQNNEGRRQANSRNRVFEEYEKTSLGKDQ